MLGAEQSRIFIDILSGLYLHHDEEGVYQFVLEQAVKSLHAEGGTLFVSEPEKASLIPVAAVGVPLEKLQKLPFKFGLGICGWVAQNCQSLIINDVSKDKRFTDLYDKMTGFTTRSILTAPLPLRKECLGVIELFNRTDRSFHPEDLFMLDLLGKHMAIALENAILYQKLCRLGAFSATVLNCLPGGFVGVDQQGIVIVCNQKAAEILGLNGRNVIGESLQTAFKRHPLFQTILELTIKENTLLFRQETELLNQPQNIRIGYSTLAIRAADGEHFGYGIVFQDIAQYKK